MARVVVEVESGGLVKVLLDDRDTEVLVRFYDIDKEDYEEGFLFTDEHGRTFEGERSGAYCNAAEVERAFHNWEEQSGE